MLAGSVVDGWANDPAVGSSGYSVSPSFGRAFRAAFLTDDVDEWLVLDWDGVPTFGAPLETQQFQIWVQTTAESLTYAYGAINGSGSSDGLTVGAENRDGSSGVNLGAVPASGSDYTIVAGAPTPGGEVTITYDAVGKKVGSFVISARLKTDVTPGITTERVNLQVT